VLPIEPVDFDEESKDDNNSMSCFHDISGPPVWTQEGKKQALKRFQLIKRKKICYGKPVLVIYNPNSGKKINLVPTISARFETAKIKVEFKPTQKYLDPFNFAREIDFTQYSLLIVAGGDGTIHEVVNGMLMRDDKKLIPLAFIPNGSGDDFCSAIGVMSVDHALDYICKGEIIKCDTARILMDHETEETLPEGIERLNHLRYMMINSGAALPPLVAFKAKAWKACCGKTSYTIATLIEAIKGNIVPDIFDVFLDGQKVT
jgi:diacylglycerol kinase family enzyme